jgi:hypothetical protein
LYCDADLPSFLYSRRNSGALPTTEDFEKIRTENEAALAVGTDTIPEKVSRKKVTIEEPTASVIEEVATPEAVAE